MKRLFLSMLLISVVGFGSLYAGGKQESSSMMQDDAMMMSAAATMLEFTTIEDAQMYAESGPTVLFFVDDSEDSKMAEMTIDEHFAELPPHVTLITVPVGDTQLTEKYGVSAPGTFVLIDGAGMARSQWTGGDIETFTMMIEEADKAM